MPKSASQMATLACLALAVGLTGCAPPIVRASRIPCNTGVCKIPVKVDHCNIMAGDIEVHGKSRVIMWTLDPHSQYVFGEHGIAIKDPGTEFTDGHPTSNGKAFQWHDANSTANATPYKYTVTIEGCAVPLDPSIFNRG